MRSFISLEQFNKNIIDPVKFAFDKALYGLSCLY
ncbi:MAG: Eco47II family restriction endonuclease [Fibrobacter sp.]|nr:Eco47II family restriction endonuclease [Fibrobacter sp.]